MVFTFQVLSIFFPIGEISFVCYLWSTLKVATQIGHCGCCACLCVYTTWKYSDTNGTSLPTTNPEADEE